MDHLTESSIHEKCLRSALCCEGVLAGSAPVLNWVEERREAHQVKIEQIPLEEMRQWSFDEKSGNICHSTGRFFTIEGIRVHTNYGNVDSWDQPIINQPEIGYLGFITRTMNGVLHFLVQAKMEPGNIDKIQLGPTLQATRSNFTRVHHGKPPPYLEYFQNHDQSAVLVDSLQSEQGARFLKKRNRNIVIEVFGEVPIVSDYCWLTLGQIQCMMEHNNIVNMDARTVLSCIPCSDPSGHESECGLERGWAAKLGRSVNARNNGTNSNETIISWFTEQKFTYDLEVDRIPLNEVSNWAVSDGVISHESGGYFSVIACRVEADNREVESWDQPLVKMHQQGLIAFVVKDIGGILHFLVQAKVEPGNFDVVEMAPTVQCLTGSYERAQVGRRPPFVNYVLRASGEMVHVDTLQSEEGGRFYHEENRNLVIEADDEFPTVVPPNYIWMTAGQLREFIKYNNFVNVQARCLLACIGIGSKDGGTE